ncbi:type 4b pilus protein PilO2 [Cupriavidus pinatubonensis]|uniref:Uncharacterized protein n=1 Tax=Cupriavidus pinatubonensis TaxID=248026 RepID=A0ABM8WRI2_9BURK|nr:type 4b pilus protein PilO2 [Cupriavidus pinatubonensis]CAG9170067.1 hypothetical protein LMG23994_01803 [Cupriavidus pinatubonensis]
MNQENATPSMASTVPVTITTINGKQFVSGLFWQPLTRPRAYMKEAREIGKREGMDIVAIRHSTIMQAGFVGKNQGVLKGMYSIAATLAGKLGSSWLGVFELDDGRYAFVAVNDGAIVPGCDMVGDRDEVREKLGYIYGLFSWEKVYVPANFEYGGETLDIKTLLTPANLRKEYRLKQLTFGLTKKELLIIGVALATAVTGMVAYSEWKAEQARRIREERIRADQIRQRELAELNAKAKREQGAKALEHPWSKMPSAEEFQKGCTRALNALPLSVRGWIIDSATCDGKAVKATFVRGPSGETVAEFLAAARERFSTDPDVVDGGESAPGEKATVLAGDLSLGYGGDDPLRAMPATLANFISHFQGLGIKPTLTVKAEEQKKPQSLPGQESVQAVAEVVKDWKTVVFQFDTGLSPELALSGLDGTGIRYTGLRVELARDTATLKWIVEGEIYAK